MVESCLEDDVVAAFVEGRLHDSDRANAHIAECAKCRRVVLLATRGAFSPSAPGFAPTAPAPPSFLDDVALARGTTIDRYVILGEIGRGGMGVVYVAYDPELDRRIAIKLIRPDVDGDRAQARLAREARSIAQLAHPNVIAVFDVGVHDGDLFVAMEYVDGQSLGEWLKVRRPWREVLAVFRQAGAGLAAAHAAGLVHRDFKPANVLIGNDRRVRVGDFGLARFTGEATRASLADMAPPPPSATLTRTGAIVGTLGYMAPEQLALETVDARSDQFSFAVALFEALHGVRPFAGKTPDALHAAIEDGTIDVDQTSVPLWLRAAVTRGLAAKPEARYPSLDAFLGALEPSRGRRLYVGAGVVALAAAAGAAALAWRSAPRCSGLEHQLDGVWDASRQTEVERAFVATKQSHARDTFALVVRELDAYAAAWLALRVDACEAGHPRPSLPCLDDRRSELQAVVGVLASADDDVVRNSVRAVAALTPLAVCSAVPVLVARDLPLDPVTRARVDGVALRVARVDALGRAGKYKLARAEAAPIIADARAIGHHPLLARALVVAGELADHDGDGAAAESMLGEAVDLAGHDDELAARAWTLLANVEATTLARTDEGLRIAGHAAAAIDRLADGELARSRLELVRGAALEQQGHYREALAELEHALATRRRLLGDDDLEVADALGRVANALGKAGRYAESKQAQQRALAVRERVLGPHHPDVARSLVELGTASLDLGDLDGAETAFRRALAIRQDALGAEHPDVGRSLADVALVQRQRQNYADAFTLTTRALAIAEHRLGSEHPEVAEFHYQRGLALVFLQRPDDARVELERGLAILERAGRGDRVEAALLHGALSQVDGGQGRATAGIEHARRAFAIEAHVLGEDHPLLARGWQWLGQAYAYGNQLADALAAYQHALALQEKTLGPIHRELAGTTANLADIYFRMGKPDEAARLGERTVAIREASLGRAAPRLTTDLVNLARYDRAAGRHTQAIGSLERALALDAWATHAHRLYEAQLVLAMERWDTGGDRAAAIALAAGARDGLADIHQTALAAEATRWIATHR